MGRLTFYRFAFILFLLFGIISIPAAVQAQQPAILVIEGGTLIDGNGGEPLRDALVILRGNRIETVSQKGQASYPAGARVLRADGKFILPGLMDAHVHSADWLAELFLAHGVTSIFDIGTGSQLQLVRREAVARGKIPGPRIFAALESLLAPVGQGHAVFGREGCQELMTVEKAVEVVKRAIAAGADLFNIHRGLTLDVWKATIEEAHKAGLPVVAQPLGPTLYAREAILAGADILEHAAGIGYSIVKDPSQWERHGEIEIQVIDPTPFVDMDQEKAADLIQLMVERNVYVEPDLIAIGRGIFDKREEWKAEDQRLMADPNLAYIPAMARGKWMANYGEFDYLEPAEWDRRKRGFQNMQRFIGQFVRAGGKVMTGTDTSGNGGWNVTGIGLHREMELFIESGLTPMQAIMAATRNVAEGYRVLDRLGTIEVGKLADLMVVNADPLQDIRNTQKIEWVIKDGKVIDRTYHPSFKGTFTAAGVEALEWVEALKQVTLQGVPRSGLADPTWAFGQPCPGIEYISPSMVTEGDPTLTLTIQGVNFTPQSQVYFDGEPVPTQLVSATELRATIDAGLIRRARTFPITVQNPGPPFFQPQWGSTSNRAHLLVNFRY